MTTSTTKTTTNTRRKVTLTLRPGTFQALEAQASAEDRSLSYLADRELERALILDPIERDLRAAVCDGFFDDQTRCSWSSTIVSVWHWERAAGEWYALRCDDSARQAGEVSVHGPYASRDACPIPPEDAGAVYHVPDHPLDVIHLDLAAEEGAGR